jgi:pyruvate/2-oxoglutarate dehydrogenase complex dihydrolipoamide dehydrogenase (E3) component
VAQVDEQCTVLRGHARFVTPNEPEIGEQRVTADQPFINVGGRPVIPPIPGIDQIRCFTSETIWTLT